MPGLEALLANAPAQTSAVALTECTVLFLSGRFFRRLIAAVPEVVEAIRAASRQVPPPLPLAPAPREVSHAC
jgi:CRP-like cAMP-binding protein